MPWAGRRLDTRRRWLGKVLNTPDARHGLRGLYTSQVRCVPDMKIVIFVVAGPSNKTATYVDEIADHF